MYMVITLKVTPIFLLVKFLKTKLHEMVALLFVTFLVSFKSSSY